ncbi:Carboxylesterase family-domain-containing protein [Lobosporangium transversale]|uniref:Carboxylesterase family-domain-containing protein n=1 Tax=Lobosporangium transversale TaxID=64571 RepID=A0A1Y2GPR6_9FUNG|nr:Carboxylesterase family-domain-containing protein [Lobosporangium transversale]ORZ16677.1 Carboxylesterase family-domain-containing protein [Lobosporangium transversale]|eukprot:XP_021881612.1 Carboxylesterase family-domain-containing protein [Lobosporangium transversale]
MFMLRSTSATLALCLVASHFRVSDAAAPTVGHAPFLAGPLASDIGGAHLLLENDVDSSTAKHAFLLLSKPRGYYDGMEACASMGDSGYIFVPGTVGANSLVSLLKKNAPAQKEASAFSQFWIYNAMPGVVDNCLAVNRNTGRTDWIPCTTQLPTVCFNSVKRCKHFSKDTSRQIRVNTPIGSIQGWRDQNAFRFLGIPYAEPPVGDLRFAAPVAKAPFKQTWDAIRYKSVCPQTTGITPKIISYLENEAPESEDCLYLNVYTPSLKGPNEPLLPVMFYIHGGSYTSFSGSTAVFEPGNMVSRGGVVVITFNYRLGLLGFLENEDVWPRSSIPGNQAFRDQILALQWVKKNIASFGGDPNRLTVFGESSGATSIRALLSAPSTWGLYQSIIAQSDPINIPFDLPLTSARVTNYFMEALGCGVTDLNCARSRSMEKIIKAQIVANSRMLAENKWATEILVQRPTIDGQLIPAEFSQLVKTGKYNTKANIMWSSTKDEVGRFIPHHFPKVIDPKNASVTLDLFFDTSRADKLLKSEYFQPDPNDPDGARNLVNYAGAQYFFFCPLRYLSRQIAKNKKIYKARFNYGRNFPFVGCTYCSVNTGRVCHGSDIQPVFASGASVPGHSQKGDDARFARQVVDRFTAFAKTGDPNPKPDIQGFEATNPDVTSVQWIPYDGTDPVLELNITSIVSRKAFNDVCTWFDTEFLYDFWLRISDNTP